MSDFDIGDDTIDSRDVIARIEELREAVDSLRAEFDAMPESECVDFDNWVRNQVGFSSEEYDELLALEALAEQCEGYGDWEHGETIINRDYFVKYIEEFIDDCYDIPQKDGWPYNHLKVDYEAAAKEAEQDYTSVKTKSGHEYLMRA